MSAQDTAQFSPIFIVGAERSGTTLLAGLLDRHSRIAASPETHFFYGADSTDLATFSGTGHGGIVDWLFARDRIGDLELDRERVADRFRAYGAEHKFLLQAVLEEYAAQRGKAMAAEKSPHHLFHVPLILEWFPDAKVIGVVRDGRDVALSLMKAPWTHEDLWKHSAKWNLFVKKGLALTKQYPQSFISLQFEDLLRGPEQELTRVLGFVGLDFEAGQLDHERETFVVPEWEKEWKEKAKGPLDTARIAAWKKTASREEVWVMNAVMGPTLSRLGYEDTAIRDCPPWRRLGLGVRSAAYRAAYLPPLYPAGRWLEKRIRNALQGEPGA